METEQFKLMLDAEEKSLTVRSKRPRRQQFSPKAKLMRDLARDPVPSGDEISFNHSGLCQTFLPHQRPASNSAYWERRTGKFTLRIVPGVMTGGGVLRHTRAGRPAEKGHEAYVGVPFGASARLIMLHMQSEAVRRNSPEISLGDNLTAYLHSIGRAVTGGERGTIQPVIEQVLRIARCKFTLEFKGDNHTTVTDQSIVEKMELWNPHSDKWDAEIRLSREFFANLEKHAVPLDRRAIAKLSQTSLGLDLYALFAYRLPRINQDDKLVLTWDALKTQMGAGGTARELARRVRDILPLVLEAYPEAKVEVTQGIGRQPSRLIMRHSKYAVPTTQVVVRALGA